MKRTTLSMSITCIIATAALLYTSPCLGAGKGSKYLGFKGGSYAPAGDLEKGQFETGGASEFTFGYFVRDTIALEGGLGTYDTRSPAYGLFPAEEELWTITPVTFSAKGVLAYPRYELAALLGVGVYLLDGQYSAATATQSDADSDRDTVLGAHAGVELTVNLGRRVFLVLENRFIRTGKADLSYSVLGQDIKRRAALDGSTLMFSIGIRL